MIDFASTVGIEPRWFGRAPTKPGHGEPEPLKPAHTCDSAEHVAQCLNCPLPSCRPELTACPLNGRKPCVNGVQKQTRWEKIRERDRKVRDLILAGWRNDEAICEELKICKTTLYWAKRRLRERGELHEPRL